MDTWESFFREKSGRRHRAQSRAKLLKAGVVVLIAVDLVLVAVLLMR